MSVRRSQKTTAWFPLLVLVVAISGGALLAYAAGPAIVYIKPGGAGNGSSWAQARDLAPALAAAISGDELWVAAGTYRPTTTNADPRIASFTLKNGIALYGGFVGTETTRDQRNWITHVVTLTGDIGTVGDSSDNSYHVVIGANNATIDGVTITAGNADVLGQTQNGGGMENASSNPVLSNLIITGNHAIGVGGGMYNLTSNPVLANVVFTNNGGEESGGGMENDTSNPVLNNVSFNENGSIGIGGGMHNVRSNPVLTNVSFNSNNAPQGGGGMQNDTSTPVLTNVSFRGNRSETGGGIENFASNAVLTNIIISGNSGGGIHNFSSDPVLTNVTISGNSSVNEGGIDNTNTSNPTIRNSIVWGNAGGAIVGDPVIVSNSLIQGGYATGTHILNVDPQFVTPINPASAPTIAGNFHLRPISPAINQGDNSVTNPTLPLTDLAGNRRIVGGRVDLGAYEVSFLGFLPLVIKAQ